MCVYVRLDILINHILLSYIYFKSICLYSSQCLEQINGILTLIILLLSIFICILFSPFFYLLLTSSLISSPPLSSIVLSYPYLSYSLFVEAFISLFLLSHSTVSLPPSHCHPSKHTQPRGWSVEITHHLRTYTNE